MKAEYRADHKAILDTILLDMPGVKGGKMFGYPAYKVGKKAFAFVGGNGIAIKLPREKVAEMVASGDAFSVFQPVEGTVWQEWLSIDHDQSKDYLQYNDLLLQSVEFVSIDYV